MRATLDLGTSIQPVCTCVFLFVVDFVTFVILFQGVQFTSIGLCGFHLLNRYLHLLCLAYMSIT